MITPNSKLSEETRWFQAAKEILKEIVMKQWLNQCIGVKILGANFRVNDNSLSGFMDHRKD